MIRSYALYLKSITTKKNALLVTLVSLLYLVLSSLLIGYKSDQLFLVVVFNVMYFGSITTRRFILAFTVFIVFWVIFDSMKAFPNYKFNPVHVKELYTIEKQLFGVNDNGVMETPNEYLQKHTTTFLDVLTGFFYINWMPVPLIFAFYLFRKNKIQFLNFSISFLVVNFVGFIVYYLYPAAPPWYVQEYGFEVNYDTPGNTAGLARFDNFFGVSWFHSLYAKSSNVFAAMPSLHSAYPVVVFYYGLKNRLGYVNYFLGFFMIGIWFSAVYSNHHYTLDVLAGMLCAMTGLFIYQRILLRTRWFRKFLLSYKRVITNS